MSKKNGSEKFNELVQSLASLPSIGRKTALRLAYHLSSHHIFALKLAQDIENATRFIKPCMQCGNLCEDELCEICIDENRDKNLLCVVQSPKDVLILEVSGSFEGLYFVLESLEESQILRLRAMIEKNLCKELIFALTQELGAEAIIFFIEERLKDMNLHFSQIAQGIPSGVSLENVDFMSLHKAISFRTKLE